MRKVISVLVSISLILCMTMPIKNEQRLIGELAQEQIMFDYKIKEKEIVVVEEVEVVPIVEEIPSISNEEFNLLTNLVMAEAENQSWIAQFYIACVVLNRVKSNIFPNTITEVIMQENQFSCMWNGRFERVTANESCISAVETALVTNDLPSNVYYFTSCGYLNGTDPWARVNDMYFSSQK